MIDLFLTDLREYAIKSSHIESVILVGSYARGTNKEDSDIDVVIITSDKAGMVQDTSFTEAFGVATKLQTEYYGACTSIRAWYKDGKEVEFGIVEPSWIAVPLDSGTYGVLSDGYKVLLDKCQFFQDLKLDDPGSFV